MQTAKMTFILKDVKSLTDTLIYCVIRIGDLRMKYSTNQKVNPKLWDKDSHQVIVSGSKDQKEKATATNLQLNRYFKVFQKIDTERIKLDLQPTLEYYRTEFDKEFKKSTPKQEQQTNLMQFIEEWIKTADRKKGSKTAYNTTLKALKEFETPSRRLDFDKITLEFKDQFVNHLKKQKSAVNTIHKHIKNIKVFMENAYQRSLHNNTDYKKKLFQVETEETFSITMSEKELEILFNKKIENSKLDRVRDIFILACRTGLRFSDLRQLTANNIINNGTQIRLTTIKTGEQVVIVNSGPS